MGISYSIPSFGLISGGDIPCTTTSTTAAVLPTSTVKLAQSTTKITSTPVTTKTTSSSSSSSSTAKAAASAFPRFYLKSTCDNSCLGHFADDKQIYSNAYTSSSSTYDSFYLNGTTLYDATTGTLCVSSEAGGSQTRFQCSNDLDYINGVPLVGGFGSAAGQLTYMSSPTFYGCGVLDLANNYEPNGLTYSTVQGDPNNCRACYFQLVSDVAQCSGQAPATTTTASYLAPCTTLVVSSPTAAPTTTSASSTKAATSTTTSSAPVVTPKACQEGYCKVSWLSQPDCYVQDCGACPWGTSCQTYQTWPWTLTACLPQKQQSSWWNWLW